jgi:predicted Zn-dependent protease
LAFVIAHEYAHIEQKHSLKKTAANAAQREAVIQALSQMDERLKQKGSGKIKRGAAQVVCGLLGGAGLAVTSQLESQHYETKADERGIEVAEVAGYKPEASVTAHQKLHGGRVPEIGLIQSIASSHPAPRTRHEYLSEKSKKCADRE